MFSVSSVVRSYLEIFRTASIKKGGWQDGLGMVAIIWCRGWREIKKEAPGRGSLFSASRWRHGQGQLQHTCNETLARVHWGCGWSRDRHSRYRWGVPASRITPAHGPSSCQRVYRSAAEVVPLWRCTIPHIVVLSRKKHKKTKIFLISLQVTDIIKIWPVCLCNENYR